MSTFVFGFFHDNTNTSLVWTENADIASPVWAKNITGLTDGIGLTADYYEAHDRFAPDYGGVFDRWYAVHVDGDATTSEALFYNSDLRNSGTWIKKFDLAALKTATGDSTFTRIVIAGVKTTPTIPGSIWISLNGVKAGARLLYVAHSHDHGNTWTVAAVTIGGGASTAYVGNLVINDYSPNVIYFVALVGGDSYSYRSLDSGHTWAWTNTSAGNGTATNRPPQMMMPYKNNVDGDIVYLFDSDGLWKTINGVSTCTWSLVNGSYATANSPAGVIPSDNSLRIFSWESYTATTQLKISADGGASFVSTAAAPDYCRVACAKQDSQYFGGLGYAGSGSATDFAASYNGVAWTDRDGNIASLFPSANLTRCSYIFAYTSAMIQVHAVEGIPATESETPLAGDRSAWSVLNHDTLHTDEIGEDTYIRHLPAPGTAGDIIQDDGTSWVAVPNADLTSLYTEIEAGENLSAGDIVDIYNDGGTAKARKAGADDPYPADGFVLASYTITETATVYLFGKVTGLSGMTPGAKQFLSTNGARTQIAPSTSGYIVQEVGIALSATEMKFEPQQLILLA